MTATLRPLAQRFFACTVTMLAFVASAQANDMTAMASQQLSAALKEKHPEITQWNIEPLVPESRQPNASKASFTAADFLKIGVLKMGARSAVRISWQDQAASKYATTMWFAVSGTRAAMVAAHDLNVGHPLEKNDAAVAQVDAMREANCTLLDEGAEFGDLRMRRAQRAGTALCREALELRPAVARGDDVVVRYVSEHISLTTKGVAQHDARIGQKLRIANPKTKDAFFARVIANREVEIHE